MYFQLTSLYHGPIGQCIHVGVMVSYQLVRCTQYASDGRRMQHYYVSVTIYASLVATCCRREFLNGEICLASGDHVMDLKVNSDQIDNMKDML